MIQIEEQFDDSQIEVTSEPTENGSKGGGVGLLSLFFLALLSFCFCLSKRVIIENSLEG